MRLHISIKDTTGKSLVTQTNPELEAESLQAIDGIIREAIAKSATGKRVVCANVVVEIDLFVDVSTEVKP